MNGKIILLIIMCCVAGLSFLGAGFYFLMQKNPAIKKCGYLSNVLGALTLVFGMLIFAFPEVAALLALTYMIVLVMVFAVLYFVFIKRNN